MKTSLKKKRKKNAIVSVRTDKLTTGEWDREILEDISKNNSFSPTWLYKSSVLSYCRYGGNTTITSKQFPFSRTLFINFLTQILQQQRRKNQHLPVIEQVGTYDPMTNEHGEKLMSLNFERIRHWIGSGAHLSTPVAELLGIAGFYPIHPKTYMHAWRHRQRAEQQAQTEGEAKESSSA